jgi:hypothetical protein
MSKVPTIKVAQKATADYLKRYNSSRENIAELLVKYGVKSVGGLQVGQIPPFLKDLKNLT